MEGGWELLNQADAEARQERAEARLDQWLEKVMPVGEDGLSEVDLLDLKARYFEVKDGKIHVKEGFSFQGFDELPLMAGLVVEKDLDLRNTAVEDLPVDLEVKGDLYINGTAPRIIAQAELLKKEGKVGGSLRFDSEIF